MSGNVDENNMCETTVAARAILVTVSLKSHSFTPSPLPGVRFDKNTRFTCKMA